LPQVITGVAFVTWSVCVPLVVAKNVVLLIVWVENEACTLWFVRESECGS